MVAVNRSGKSDALKTTKNIFYRLQRWLLIPILSLWVVLPSLAVTSAYYSSLDNKSGANLFAAIHTVSKTGYSSLSYAGLWTAYKTTDVYPAGHPNAGKIWDMYGGCTFTYSSNQCGSYSDECDCYNREHSIPKSWFGGSESSNTPGTDLFHIFPTDGYVNNQRSNYAFGEVSSATYSYNNSKLGSPKSITVSNTILEASGSNTQTCSTSPVFEPRDEYKGDFARAYFGTMLRWASGDYQTFTTGDGAAIFNTAYDASHYYGLTAYGVALLMKWHRADPVSQKEIDRNNACQNTQGNRNPFIDYPCLAEYLWGNKTGETFKLTEVLGSFESSFEAGVSDGCSCGVTTTLSFANSSVSVNTGNTITNAATTNSTCATITYTSSNTSVATVSSTGVIRGVAEGTCTITASISACGDYSAKTATCTVKVGTSYTVTWMADGAPYHSNTAVSGSSPSVPEAPDDCGATRVFRGWTASSSHSGNSAPADMFTTSAPSVTKATTYYAVYADKSSSGSGTVNTTVSMNSFNAISGNVEDDSNVSYIAAQGSAGTAPAIYSNVIRIYQNGGTLTISANNSKKLTSITIGSSMATSVSYSVDGGSASANQSISANGTYTLDGIEASTVVFTCKGTTSSSRLYLNKLSVTYSGTGSTTTYSNYSLYCSTAPVTATATFMNNGATFATQSGTAGSTITIDDPTPCAGYTFEGWSTHEYATGNTEAAVIDFAGTIPNANTTYYAVYSKTVSGGSTLTNNYKKITTAGELTSGNYLIVGYSSGYQAMSTTWKDTYYLSPTAVTPASDVITTTDATIVWSITVSGSQVTISNADAGNLYIEQSGSYYNIKLGDNTTDNKFTYSVTDGNWLFRSATYTDRVLEYYSSKSRWAYYTSADAPVYLYKQQSEATGTTYHTTSPDCTCRVTVTVVSGDESQGTVSITAL